MAEFRLETERLVLRDWREEDWPPFLATTNTPGVMRWLGGVMDDARAASQFARLRLYATEFGHTFWVVERKADGALLGFCGLKRANQAGGPQGDFEIGWRLREDAHGQGYAREAAEASLAQAFAVHGAPHVLALTVQSNAPSWGLMLRLGMERCPQLDFDCPDFAADDSRIIVYRLPREAWEKRR